MENKIICPQCGSDKVQSKKSMKRTLGSVKRGRMVTSGYCFIRHTCDNGHTWEGEKVNL